MGNSWDTPYYYTRNRSERPERRSDNNYSLISTRVRAPDPYDNKTLRIEGVDLNIRHNTRLHHTDEYDVTGPAKGGHLVVRRGQPFDLTLHLNRPYDRAFDDLRICFEFGDFPSASRQTHVEFVLSDPDISRRWGSWIKSISGNNLVISVVSAVGCHVGSWKLRIDVVRRSGRGYDVFRYAHRDLVYILFNPWCKDDPVYLADEALCQEYVLEENGIIYVGTGDMPSAKPWVYGQFGGNVLDCCLWLLDTHMGDNARGDPVIVSRIVTQLVNANDEGGLVVGRWDGRYRGGLSPMHWTGSGEVFERYFRNKKPVKYGQCWVFCGVTTTFCRALGIPCRSVTNFSSAHDTDGNLTIDIHYDGDTGLPIRELNDDSIWNFHCWNDAWMARPDLPPGYGGWQAIDSTPQETSGGLFACGPASVTAMRRGDVYFLHDGSFVFTEVNADILQWVITGNGERIPIKSEKAKVGLKISTKKPLEDVREDITNQYKFPEGSQEERMAMARALQFVYGDFYNIPEDRDVFGSIRYEPNTFIGQDLIVGLTLSNRSGRVRTVDGICSVRSMYYNGNDYLPLFQQNIQNLAIGPHSEETVWMKLTQDEYFPKLIDHLNVTVSALYVVRETKLTHIDTRSLRFRKPHLAITAKSSGTLGATIIGDVTFRNPLNRPLTRCELSVEGPGLTERKVYRQRDIPAYGTFFTRFFMVPSKLGKREVVLSFNSKQLENITGYHRVAVSQ